MQERQPGPWRRHRGCEDAVLPSRAPTAPTSGDSSGPHGAVNEEFAEVHFRVATLGQELLCCALEFSIVLQNFGSKKVLLQFIFLMIGNKFLQCRVHIKNVPVKAQLGVQGLVRILWPECSFHADLAKRSISGKLKGKVPSSISTCGLLTNQPAFVVLFNATSDVHDQFVAQLYHKGQR